MKKNTNGKIIYEILETKSTDIQTTIPFLSSMTQPKHQSLFTYLMFQGV